MADRTLTINHADGGSETYTIKRDKFAGVRSMSVDGDTVTVDHTAVPKEQSKETTFGGSKSITIKRDIEPLLSKVVGGASAAYSLRDLNDKAGNNKVVRVRRASDNCERDFRAKEVKDIATWVNTQTVPPLDLQELDADGHRTGDLVEAAAAYSLRNLSASYTGSVVEVRRSSDDAEDSFTAAAVADGTLVDWVGAGNDGFVKNWYDQSGNNNHATQGTDASQPKIVDAGSLVSGGMEFDGVDDTLSVIGNPVITASSAGTYSSFSVQNISASEGGYLYGNASVATVKGGTSFYAASDGTFRFSNRSDVNRDSIPRTSGSTLLSAVYQSGASGMLVNGAGTVNSGSGYDFVAGTGDFIIGNRNGGTSSATFLEGKFQEIIIYNSDQSDNRTAIEANIGDHYDIDLPSGVDTGYDQVDGFVETWYDQSGNGNDAVQETAGRQPKIVDAGVLVSGGLAFDGGQMLRSANTFTYPTGTTLSTFITNKASNNTTGYLFRLQQDYMLWRYFSNRRVTAGANANAGGVSLNEELWSVISNLNTSGGTSNFYVDGTLAADPDKAHGSNDLIPARKIEIGGAPTSTFWIGTVNEIIYYPSDQSANRVAIEANINNQYDIY